MRFIALFLLAIAAFGAEYPQTFSIAGDSVYKDMYRYMQIKHLPIYQQKPELLEAFCLDANKTMQRGFALDKMQEDMEAKVDKKIIKSYAQELRQLSVKNELITKQIQKDMRALYQQKEFDSLEQMEKAGFVLEAKMHRAISEYKESALSEKPAEAAVMPLANKDEEGVQAPQTATLLAFSVSEEAVPQIQKEQAEAPKERTLGELEYYQMSLANLKDELYTLRESEEKTQTACLNDITAINYWMIRVLESEKDACAQSDAIKQMKSYDKKAAQTCGRDSMRYIEWHGRIKPYAGQRLFESEAACHR